jgi:2-amino-4-hydroxy-6-hydroxymethyldihydropteridine diphosphokinase
MEYLTTLQLKLKGKEMDKYDVIYLSFGTNIGNRKMNLTEAIEMLSKYDGISIVSLSNIYETEPVGFENQDRFLNMAVKIKTKNINVLKFLDYIHEIENIMGRKRLIRWGPRVIDLDILIFNDFKIDSKNLTIPHKEMFRRAFVLIPLKDIFDDWNLYNIDFDNVILKCNDKNGVSLFTKRECFKEIGFER